MPPDLHHLVAYLKAPRPVRVPLGLRFKAWFSIALLIFVAAAAGLYVIRELLHMWWLIFVFGGGFIARVSQWIREQSRKAESAAMNLSPAHRHAFTTMRELADRESFPERIHPAVGRELDACADAALQIRAILSDGRMPEIREDALNGVDEEMQDALLEAEPWVRPSGGSRKSFSARVEANPEPAEVERLRQRAERLTRLRDDLSQSGGARRGVDRILSGLQERREAEEELRQGL